MGESLARGFAPTAVFPSRWLALLMAGILPGTASAACAYDLQVRTYYYSDPELTNYVGQCFKACWSGTTCSGEQTEYSQIVSVRGRGLGPSCEPKR